EKKKTKKKEREKKYKIELTEKKQKQHEERSAIMEGVKILQKTSEEIAKQNAQRAKDTEGKKEVRYQKGAKILKSLLSILPTESGTSSLLVYFKNLEELYV